MKFEAIIFICLCWSYSSAQDTLNPCPKDGICPYHEVSLKNHYQLNIGDTINNRRTIRLLGPGTDTIIRSVNVKNSNASLGWLVGDYEDVFVLYSTYSGNYSDPQPTTVNVFQKSTGTLLLSGPLVEYINSENAILFIDYNQQENLGLFDLSNLKIEMFGSLDTPCESWWRCIKYNYVTEKDVTVEYRDWNTNTKRKIYIRQHRL